ncbi:MAG: hemolysin family protein [bacterium]|nr:hemolysin family protein [bacterium]
MVELLIIVLLSIFNGVFAMSETAVVASRRARLAQRAEEGDHSAQAALKLIDDPARFLSTVQIAITLVGQISGAFAGATLAEQLAAALREQNSPLAPYAEPVSFTLIVLLTTYLSLIIGELVPKSLALRYPERIASLVAPPMQFLSVLTRPVVTLLTASTNLVLRLIGVRPSDEPPVSEEEIVAMIQQGVDVGVFAANESDMIENVFRLNDRRAYQLMTPRTEVIWLDVNDTPEENQRKIIDSHFSRFPVCENDLDHVIGIVSTKNILARQFNGQPFDLRAAMHEPIFVPESISASKLLQRFRESGRHSALVIGEYGGFEGMITIQDILEDLVGGDDIENPSVVKREDGSLLIDAMMLIDDFIDLIDVEAIPGAHEEFETLAGFVLTQHGNIPKAGDHFTWSGYRFEVVDMDGNRVDKVLVTPPAPKTEDEKPAADDA